MNESLQDAIRRVAHERGLRTLHTAKGRGRYEYAVLQHGEEQFFIKAGVALQPDYDEPILFQNLQREIWWAEVVAALEERQPSLPFTSPRVVATNATRDGCNDEAAWVIFTFEKAHPLAGASIWDIGQAGKEWDDSRVRLFRQHLARLCVSLAALEHITKDDVQRLPVPLHPPHRAHGETRMPQEFVDYLASSALLPVDELQTATRQIGEYGEGETEMVLGQGDFEVSHLHVREDEKIVLVDNEFSGWYPNLDSLTYCYHRLWANRRNPPLAQDLLRTYLANHTPERESFFTQFYRILLPRVLRGIYYDARRRNLGPETENQRLRRELLQALLKREVSQLTGAQRRNEK